MGTDRRERTMIVQIFAVQGVWTGLRAHRGGSEPSPTVSTRPTRLTPRARWTRYLPAPPSNVPVVEFRRSPCAIICRPMPDAGRTRRIGRICPGAGHAGCGRRGSAFVDRVCDGDMTGGSTWSPAVSCPRRRSPAPSCSACGLGSNLSRSRTSSEGCPCGRGRRSAARPWKPGIRGKGSEHPFRAVRPQVGKISCRLHPVFRFPSRPWRCRARQRGRSRLYA